MDKDRAIEAVVLAKAGLDVEALHRVTGLSRDVCRGLIKWYREPQDRRLEREFYKPLAPSVVSAFGHRPTP